MIISFLSSLVEQRLNVSQFWRPEVQRAPWSLCSDSQRVEEVLAELSLP